MRRLATAEELAEKLSKLTNLSDWLEQPVHEVVTTKIPSLPAEKEN